jgi:phage tail-like protein
MDPPFVGRFKLDIDGTNIGAFTEVSGLSVSIDVEELAEGGQNGFTHKLLGRMKWPNIVFKRGLTDTDALFEWLNECSGPGLAGKHNALNPKNGTVRNGSISVLSAGGSEVRTWTILGAKPVKWTGPRLAASSRDLAIEELEVCHSGFTSR